MELLDLGRGILHTKAVLYELFEYTACFKKRLHNYQDLPRRRSQTPLEDVTKRVHDFLEQLSLP